MLNGKLTSTQEQMLTSKNKYESKIRLQKMILELENLRHRNILEEIEQLKKAKITQFSRGKDEENN